MKTNRNLWVIVGCLAWVPVASADEGKTLMEQDRKFDAETAKKGGAGWASFFAPNGSMQMGEAPPVIGPKAIEKAMTPVFARPGFSLRWEPKESGLWVPGKLGWTKGRFTSRAKDKAGKTVVGTGTYITIWKKQKDGSWKVLFDTGVPDRPAEEPPP